MFRFNGLAVFVFFIWFFTTPVSLAAGKPTLHKFAGYEMGYGTYAFGEKLDHKIVFPVASLTAGLAYQRFSYVLNLSGSLSDADISEEEQVGRGARRDIDLTVGYQLSKKISLFIGYKDGVSKIDFNARDPAAIYGTGNERYEQQGLFAGVNVNWAYKNAGKLSLSVAYARFDASNHFLQDELYDPAPPLPAIADEFEFDDVGGDSQGATTGFSYTFSYTLPIKGSLLFRTRLRVNAYQQDISGTQAVVGNDNYPYAFTNISESSTMLLVGVTSVF